MDLQHYHRRPQSQFFFASGRYSTHQKLSIEQVAVVKGLRDAAVPPRSIHHQLEVTHGVKVPIKKLYKTFQQLKKKEVDGKSPIEVLVKLFRDEAYGIGLVSDDNGRVTYCFIAHPTMVESMRLNYDVLVLDSTYKANKYRLPLLHVVDSTALHTTFSAAFVFTKNKNEESYRTAVVFLHKLFHPNAFPKVFAVDRELALISAWQY